MRAAKWLAAILLCFGFNAEAEGVYTDSMYRTALAEMSTSPLFVLITLRDARDGTNREVCIPAPFLLGAIHRERHLPYDAPGSAEAVNIALRQADRSFTFTSADALRNVQPRYTPALLAQMRSSYAGASIGQMLAGQSYDDARRDAIAHLLLERGTLVGMADLTGSLYVYEAPKSTLRDKWSPEREGPLAP